MRFPAIVGQREQIIQQLEVFIFHEQPRIRFILTDYRIVQRTGQIVTPLLVSRAKIIEIVRIIERMMHDLPPRGSMLAQGIPGILIRLLDEGR